MEKTKDSNRIYEGKILNLRVDTVSLPGNRVASREVIEHNGAAAVVAIDEKGRILMVRQYRYPMEEQLLELPAGKIDRGESPQQCAFRELEEETGYRCESLKDLGVIYPAAAYLTEKVYLFYTDCLIPSHQHLDEDEDITVEWLDFEDVLKMVLEGQIPDSKTQIGVLKAHRLLGEGKLRAFGRGDCVCFGV